MLHRLFKSRNIIDSEDTYTKQLLEPQTWEPQKLDLQDVRILFCQDSGESNKTVLYDSEHNRVQKNESRGQMAHSWNDNRIKSNTGPGTTSMSFQPKHQHGYMKTMPSLSEQRHSNRKLDLIGDMIFGTAPLAYKGMNTKIHYYKRDRHPQIIISKLFTLNNSHSQRRASFSSINSDFSSLCFDDTLSESDDDGHLYYPPILGLRIKRNRRFGQTNMETTFSPTPLPVTPTQAVISNCRMKYAIAFIITLHDKNETLYDFIFSHFSLIENRLHQLQAVASKQLYQHFRHPSPLAKRRANSNPYYLYSDSFQHNSEFTDAVCQFKQSIFDLYSVPRIQEPLWLNMSTFPHRKTAYQTSLLKELMDLVHQFNHATYQYFVSTLLTGVLMHHLSWVCTVAPPDTNIHIHQGNYDPLWAQLSDLYGFVGTPSRISRTIVIGLRPNVVRRILYILTYFVRCNEVYETIEDRAHTMIEDSIFGQEVKDRTRLEDRIVQQLKGDVESIAIPNSNNKPHETFSSSLESTLSNRFSEDGSPDTFASLPFLSSIDIPNVSSGSYPLTMPKSTIMHMEPDITQEEAVSAKPSRLYAKSYGRSLMATYCSTYKSDFVLMGLPVLPSTQVIDNDLHSTLEQFTLTDSVTDASCLVIDSNQFKCRVLNHKLTGTENSQWKAIVKSDLVHTMLEEITQIYDQEGIGSAEKLFELMEDKLQLIYLYSTMLQDAVQENHTLIQDSHTLASQLGLNQNDIPLLLNVCGTFDSKIWDLQKTTAVMA
ncbi:folliculin-interacting protein middle domain-containing protein [Sporodiniella umbellata]|nr:folliculin-interacting protein middle domain-containing protein [Sporodiniella umbellata]